MKLRTLLAVGAVGMASAAFATGTVNSENTFGILALPDTTSTNLMISVPWVDCTDGSQNTLVSNVVKTTNLKAGDYLILKDGSTYNSWVLTGTAPNLHWTAQVVATSDAGVTTSVDATGKRVARGMALWLHRSDPAKSSPIYLFGQYSAAGATTTITAGSTTMIANPGTTDLKISAITGKFTSGAPANGDKVMVNTASGYKTYTYNGSAWTYKTSGAAPAGENIPALPGSGDQTALIPGTGTVTDSDVIPAGKGFWYQSKTGTVTRTITW